MRRKYVLDGTPVSLRGFLADNELSPEEARAIRALLPGDTYTGGGGAAPEWTLRCEAAGKKLPSPAITERPEWGLAPVGEYCAIWGARAILDRSHKIGEPMLISLLWDRQGAKGPKHELDALSTWLNGKSTGLKQMRREIHLRGIGPTDSERVRIQGGPHNRFTLDADPRSSHGYLYLVATVAVEV
jgi:hypothetical protein